MSISKVGDPDLRTMLVAAAPRNLRRFGAGITYFCFGF